MRGGKKTLSRLAMEKMSAWYQVGIPRLPDACAKSQLASDVSIVRDGDEIGVLLAIVVVALSIRRTHGSSILSAYFDAFHSETKKKVEVKTKPSYYGFLHPLPSSRGVGADTR